MVNPCGQSEPWSVAEEVATFVAGLVVTTGAPVAASVVKVLSLPYLVPTLLWLRFGNDTWCWDSTYLMFALTLW